MTFAHFASGGIRGIRLVLISSLIPLAASWVAVCSAEETKAKANRPAPAIPDKPTEELRAELKQYPYKIVHEAFEDNHWVLKTINADGSNHVLLTKSLDVNELYPHVSPDGNRICFLVDEGTGKATTRSVYYSDLDGSDRHLAAKVGRDACWNADGTGILYVKPESDKFTLLDATTKRMYQYDLATGQSQEHPNPALAHLYCFCAAPGGKWLVATVHGGMGFSHAILGIEANGKGVFQLAGINGCRPDVSPDGKKLCWGSTDWDLCVADLDLTGDKPKVSNVHTILTSPNPGSIHIYHIDWSPDSKYVAFAYGPVSHSMGLAPEMIGVKAKGWNLGVADASAVNRWVPITTDGNSNKEPDWIPSPEKAQ